jgi:hypothetical protein
VPPYFDILEDAMNLENTLNTNADISALNNNQLQRLYDEVCSAVYWFRRGVNWHTREYVKNAIQLGKKVKALLNSGNAKPELSDNGSVLVRGTSFHTSSFNYFDSYLAQQGFKYLSGGDNYQAYFVNESELEIVGYCEGDITQYQCPSMDVFKAELADIKLFLVEG